MTRKADGKILQRTFAELSDADRRTLLDFARFLATRDAARQAPDNEALPEPASIPRPAEESVVGAMKRLSKRYYMLDKSKVLNETSMLMAQHVMQGRDAQEVIDELEALFESHYQRLREDRT
jgi:hypothetical protein